MAYIFLRLFVAFSVLSIAIPTYALHTPNIGVHETTVVKSRPSNRWALHLPVANTLVTSLMGTRIHPISGKQQFHNGIDIDAELNDPVFAVLDGVVLRAGPRGHYGNAVEILHRRRGIRSLVAHLNSCIVRAGQRVKRGQLIGYAGTTGASTGVHVHFTVRDHKMRRLINPLRLSYDVPLVVIAKRKSRRLFIAKSNSKGGAAARDRAKRRLIAGKTRDRRTVTQQRSAPLIASLGRTSLKGKPETHAKTKTARDGRLDTLPRATHRLTKTVANHNPAPRLSPRAPRPIQAQVIARSDNSARYRRVAAAAARNSADSRLSLPAKRSASASKISARNARHLTARSHAPAGRRNGLIKLTASRTASPSKRRAAVVARHQAQAAKNRARRTLGDGRIFVSRDKLTASRTASPSERRAAVVARHQAQAAKNRARRTLGDGRIFVSRDKRNAELPEG